MPPTDRLVISFAAEPPQESLPYGRWAHSLSDVFYRACDDLDACDEDPPSYCTQRACRHEGARDSVTV